MNARRIGLALVAALAVAVTVMTVRISGQGAKTPLLVVTAFGGQPHPYTVPKTPWGDPDLQGVWSTDDTDRIPMSRPSQFGDRLYLNDEEFAARVKQTERGVQQAENEATSTFRFDFGRRAFRQASLIVDPPNGQLPAYTAEGRTRPMPRGTYGNGPLNWTTDFSLYERCITRGIMGSTLRVIYGNGNRIVQAPGMVVLSYEMLHDTRVFYTDGRPHIGDKIREYLGDSRARWEGDELVVETTNLTDQTAIGVNGNGNRHSTQMKLTERFKRVANDLLQYQVTIDDPVTYERPFTMSFPMTPLDGGVLLPYDCHEGNMALLQSLGAERAEDRRLEEDRAKGIIRERRPVQDGLGVGGAPAGPGGGLGGGRGRGGAPAGPPPTPGATDQER
ncbi:MAG TPA: hypothetical protein VGF24_11100 [Vicinamibacterales bacterium]|jgi:hypothetical protein